MSSILKALKKLEQEKTLRREEEIDLSREILYETPRRRAQLSWPWAAALATIILLVASVALLLNRIAVVPATTLQPQPQQVLATPPATAASVSPPAQTTGTPPAQTAPRLPVSVSRPPALAAVPARVQTPPQPLQAPPATEARPAPIPASASAPAAVVGTKAAEPVRKQPLPAAETAEPALSVSGIAWNKDSSDRLAIINGQPLTTGAAVNGAVVEEILPDRVRFSHNNRTFDVFIGKSAKSN